MSSPSESQAAASVTRGGWARVRLGIHATLGLARDPEDTHQVFLMTLALDHETTPRISARLAATAQGRRLLRERPSIDTSTVDYAALRRLPETSLGGAYARFLDQGGMNPDVFRAPPGLPPDLAYVIQRVRQTHDLWHVLTGLDTDVPGEIALQAFSYGQLGQYTSLVIASIGTLVHGPRHPGTLQRALTWYRHGRRSRFLLDAPWEDWWDRPLAEVRAGYALPAPPDQADRADQRVLSEGFEEAVEAR